MGLSKLSKYSDDEIIRELQRRLSNFEVTFMWNAEIKQITIMGSKKAIENLLAFCPEVEEIAQIIVREQ